MTFVLLLDQFSKGVVQKIFLVGEEKVIVPKFISIVYVQDSAAALGFFAHWDRETRHKFLISFSLLVVLWAIRRLVMFRRDCFKVLPYVFVISGLLGNSMDRLLHGHVVSFIKVSSWVFNVADGSILLAVLLSLFNICHFFGKKSASPDL